MDERAAFEANIDANPLDATNHLVYADWLDEHGEPDEAAFRRSMGEWLPTGGAEHEAGTGWFVHNTTPLPHGEPAGDFHPHSRYFHSSGYNRWDGYREMEQDLRRAFMANRPQRESRRTYSRRTGQRRS